MPLSYLSFTHLYSASLLLTFIPLLAKAYLQLSGFSSTCSMLSLQMAMAYANIEVYGASCLIAFVVPNANKQGLKAYHSPPPTSSLLPHPSPLLCCTVIIHRLYYYHVLLCHRSRSDKRVRILVDNVLFIFHRTIVKQ